MKVNVESTYTVELSEAEAYILTQEIDGVFEQYSDNGTDLDNIIKLLEIKNVLASELAK